MALEFENNIVPAIPEKTFGNLLFVAELDPREGYENGERTGEIIEKRVEVSSDVQKSIIKIVLPSSADLSGFKFGDAVEVTDPEFMPWAMIDADAFGNYADADVKVTAKEIKKKGAPQPSKQPTNKEGHN